MNWVCGVGCFCLGCSWRCVDCSWLVNVMVCCGYRVNCSCWVLLVLVIFWVCVVLGGVLKVMLMVLVCSCSCNGSCSLIG